MSEAKQPERMTVSDTLEIVRHSMGLWCAEYDEETGEQCQGVPVWTLKNLKHDTSSHWCEEHKPEKQHYADVVDPFRGAVAFDMIVTALATAERERDEARAELAALRTLLHEEDVQDRYRTDHGCGAGACVIERPRGMTVGGGCRCGRKALRIALQRARAELEQERADLAALTARVEAEIAAAAEAVRSRAIAECVSAALTHTIAPGLALSEPDADPTQVALARVVHRAVSAVVDTLRALSAPQPAPSEPADVDPAAGALR